MPDAPVTAAQQHDLIVKEWSQYVAVTPIDINGGRAFNVGDPVPSSHVTQGIVRDEQVARSTTKAAAAAIEGN